MRTSLLAVAAWAGQAKGITYRLNTSGAKGPGAMVSGVAYCRGGQGGIAAQHQDLLSRNAVGADGRG